MKSALFLLLVLPFLQVCVGPAAAQAPGSLGIYGDDAGTVETITPSAFVPFDVYIVGFDVPGDLIAYEFGIRIDSPLILVLDREPVPPFSVNIASEPNDFIVGLTECLSGVGAVTLGRMQLLTVDTSWQTDQLICLRPTTPSRFDPPNVGYVDCEGEPHVFSLAQSGDGIYPPGCLVLNPTGGPCISVTDEYFDLPELLALPGDRVRMPLQADFINRTLCKTIVEGYSDHGFRGTLEFDPALVEFVTASMGETAPDWQLTVSELEPGRVFVEAFDPEHSSSTYGDEALGDLNDLALMVFEFDVLQEGNASIAFAEAGRCRYGSFDPLPCVWENGMRLEGLITQNPVATESLGMGALKARFSGPER